MRKLLLTPEQWAKLKLVCSPWLIDYAMYNDPTWGFNGCGNNYCVHFKSDISLTQAFDFGHAVGRTFIR